MQQIIDAIAKGDYILVQKLFEEAIKIDPTNIALRLKYALVLYYDELNHQSEDALNVLDSILKISPHFIPAILLKGHSEYIHWGATKDETMLLGDECLNNSSFHTEYWEQLLLMKARYYEDWEKTDEEKYLYYLNESVKYSPESSTNWYILYQYYLKKGDKEKAKKFIVKGVRNAKFIDPDERFDETNFEVFINECYKGTNISSVNYQTMLEAMNKLWYAE